MLVKTLFLLVGLGFSAAQAAPTPAQPFTFLRGIALNADRGVAAVRGGPVRINDELTVAAACSSDAPVLVMDNFSTLPGGVKPYIDVDGDGKPDVGHGEVVAAIYRASGKSVIPVNMGGDASVENIVRLLGIAAAKIESGEQPISAVNLSQTIDVSFEAYSKELGLPITVTPENVRANREAVRKGVTALMDKMGSPHYGHLAKVFARLKAEGVPVIFAAGNQGPAKSNVLGLLPGAISVGALKRDGSKLSTSADSSLVSVWRLGEHALRKVSSGIDLSGDAAAEFPNELLSGGESVAGRYAGQPASSVLDVPSGGDWDIINRESRGGFNYLIKNLPEGVYRTEEMIAFFKFKAPQAEALRGRGKYIHKSLKFNFQEDARGGLVYDPAGTGASGQVGLITGTSFAAPFVCAR